MIAVIEFLIIVLIIASCITIKFKFKQENSIVITFLGITLLIYVLGLFNIMKYALFIVIILDIIGIAYIVYSTKKNIIKWSEIFSLTTVIYIFCVIILGIILKNTNFTQWDEFSHWGPNLKAMVANDLLWANNKWDGIHVVYQPLAGIIEYCFCKLNGSFSESIAYTAIDVAICTLLLPILKKLQYNFKDFIKAILFIFSIFCIIFICGFSLTSIYIDLILGIMFSIGMYIAIDEEEIENKILLFLILISMAELKTTGLLFDGIILIVLFLKKVIEPIIIDRRISKQTWANLGKIILILASILLAYASWNLYCKSNDRVLDKRHDNNFVSEIYIKEFIKAVFQYNCNNEKLKSISVNFYKALNEKDIISGFNIATCMKILTVLDIIMVIMYVKIKSSEEKKKVIIQGTAFNIGFVLYCLLLMATFMYAFTDAEGMSLASFERYMVTYFIAWIINVIGLFLGREAKKERDNVLITMLIIFLICLYGSNIETLVNPVNKNNSTIPEYIQEKADIVREKLKSSDKVYVIFQNPGYSADPFIFRYCISPIVMNLMDEYSLGELDSPEDTLTYNITEKEWEKKLIDENYDYVFIIRSDDEFKEMYKGAFDKNTNLNELEDKIFKVNKIDENNVKLVLYEGEK